MRKRRGKGEDPKTLDSVDEDEIEACGVNSNEGGGFFACYLLTTLNPRHKGHTYIGFTVNPRRRIRQHNGEITSGAWRTKSKRPWEMVLCIYGFPTNVSALQFEWAWQHPRESLAVREAAAAFKSFSGVANKIKLGYTMLTLPAWNSLNLTVNYFSSKYAHNGGLCPSLPVQMKVQVCSMDDLPCFTKQDSSQTEEDESSDHNEEEDSCYQSQSGNPTSSPDDLYLGRNEPQNIPLEKVKEPEAVYNDKLANFTGFGLEEIDEDVVPPKLNVQTEDTSGSNVNTIEQLHSTVGSLDEDIEVIDLLTPSPRCRVGLSLKRRRVSEFIDLTMSPNFIEL